MTLSEQFRGFSGAGASPEEARLGQMALSMLDISYQTPIGATQSERDQIVAAAYQGSYDGCMGVRP
ncbi:MAG: hypothetical protein P8X43_08285 [Maritimibacter sp.]